MTSCLNDAIGLNWLIFHSIIAQFDTLPPLLHTHNSYRLNFFIVVKLYFSPTGAVLHSAVHTVQYRIFPKEKYSDATLIYFVQYGKWNAYI